MTILFSLLFISMLGLVTIISYKYVLLTKFKVLDLQDNSEKHLSSKILKKKLHWLFASANDRIVRRAIVRLKDTYGIVSKSISKQHSAFTDSVNGKGIYGSDKNQRGATSIFLNTVAEHKKKIQYKRKESK